MKRVGYLYEQVYDMNNLIAADMTARRGKQFTKEVVAHDIHRESNLLLLQEKLKNKTFKTSTYFVFKIHEPKIRDIYKLPYFPDRILHHAIMRVIEPIIVSSFTRDTYACLKNRGIHALVKKLQNDLKNKTATTYCLKIDIKKYYPSIDHDILKSIIRKKIKDKDLLQLLDEIIDSADGVPIGNYLSQYLANIYLNYLDHYVKEELRIKYYYRYVDDIVILGSSKDMLWDALAHIRSYIENNLNLTIKDNYQVFPVASRGIDFVGYRFFHSHTQLRKSIKKRWIKNMMSRKHNKNLSFWSYYGWAVHCNSINLIKKITSMKKFSELGIDIKNDSFVGDKIKIDKVINREIVILDFKVQESKINEGKKFLSLQIELSGEKKVIFTGAKLLIQAITQIDKSNLPVSTTIVSENQMYQFI